MITIEHLYKNFGDRDILSDICVEFPKGKTTVILGPSGSGKTTLLRCLNVLEMPNRGQIKFGEHTYSFRSDDKMDTQSILQLRRLSGMVFQSFNLFPHRTVVQNIIEGPIQVKKQSKEQATALAMQLLEKVGLSDRADHYPHQLSGGQKQRVAIARALAMEPSVLLFDEPTSALDPELEQEVLKVIQSLAHEHNTMIIVTHNLDFAYAIADQIIFMENGLIVETGDTERIFKQPKMPRTKDFLQRFGRHLA